MSVIFGVLVILVGAGGIMGLIVLSRQPMTEVTFNEPEAMMQVWTQALSDIQSQE